jgi:hypothetical protein
VRIMSELATIRPEFESPSNRLDERIGLKSILENLRATSGRAVHVPVTESRLTGSMYL